MIVEWNRHMFSTDHERYPFHPRRLYTPEADWQKPDPLGHYLAEMEELGIDYGVLVHPEPYGDDHSMVLDCLEREPDRFLGTSLFFPRDEDAPAKLKALVRRQPRIISTRFHTPGYTDHYLSSFQEDGVKALWKTAGDLGLIVELHLAPGFGKETAAMIREFPDFTILLDHLAEPGMGNAVDYVDILRLAEHDNVYMKLSGMGHVSSQPPLYEDLKPFTRTVVEAFGPDRLVWGGGAPAIVDVHMADYSAADRAKVKGENLFNLLPFPQA